jgi:hypothetical protein
MNWQRLHLSVIGILLLSAVEIAQAVPPPLGPPAPRAPIQDLGVQAILTSLLKGQIDSVIAATNAQAATNPDVHAKVSWSYRVFGPGLRETQYSDRPNERFVSVPYSISYTVYDIQKHTAVGWVGVPVERHISQSIDLNVSCDRWQTGQGNLKLVAAAQKPYLENEQGTLEQVVNFFLAGTLTNFIDSKVRQQLPGAFASIANLPGKCDALGAYPGNLSDPRDDTIQWSFHPRLTVPTVYNQVSVKLLSLKRLVAHDRNGAVLYKPVEAPTLEFYANYQHYFVPLQSLQEGQQVALNAPPLVLNRPGDTESLVLITNVIQNVAIGTQSTDSAFRVFGRATNFGNGTQTIRVKKTYWEKANPQTGAKPYPVYVDAFELTFQVNAGLAGVVSPPGTIPPRPGGVSPGTVAPGMNAPVRR